MKMTVHPKEKFVGLFVVIAIIIGIAVIYYNVKGKFEKKSIYRLVLEKTYGLRKDDQIKLRGLVIGKIDSIDIRFDEKAKKEIIEVLVEITKEDYKDFIKRDSSVTITPALGPLPASIEIHPGIETELLPKNSDIKLREKTTTSIEDMIGDVAESIKSFKELAAQLKIEGLTRLLGPEIHKNIKSINSSLDEIVTEFRVSTTDIAEIVSDLKEGNTTISKLFFGEKPMLEVMLGEKTQKRIDELNVEKRGMLEWLLGPTIWSEVEAASQSWQPLRTAILDLLTEGKVVLQRTQDIMNETQPIIEMISENSQNFSEIFSTTKQMLSDIRELTSTITKEKEQIPIVIRQFREILDKSNKIAEALQKHWLLSAFSKPEPVKSEVPVKSLRPNHYDE